MKFGGSRQGLVAVSFSSGTPYVELYRWSAAGWGDKLGDPGTLPSAYVDLAVSPDGDHLLCKQSGGSAPFLLAYPVSLAAGFGTKLTDPVGTTVSGRALASCAATDMVFAYDGSTLEIAPYEWANAFGTKLAAPTGAANISWISAAPDGTAVAGADSSSPYVHAWAWAASGFDAKASNPGTLIGHQTNRVLFHNDSNVLFASSLNSPYFHAYKWSAAGFGTKYTDPATLPAGTGYAIAVSPDGAFVAVGHTTTPFLSVYPWTYAGGFGAKVTDPVSLPAAQVNGVTWSDDGKFLIVTTGTTPFVEAWDWSASGFGAKLADPGTLPTSGGVSIAFIGA